MRRKRSNQKPTPADLFRAPIISERLIIREAVRTDAAALEKTMDLASLSAGERTADGARRFGSGLAEVPVWSAARAVCEKGTMRIVGGVVITEIESLEPAKETWRIGWWLAAPVQGYGTEVLAAVEQRLRAMGADTVVVHVRADDASGQQTAAAAGFERGEALRHTTPAGTALDFWVYLRN